jgi:hypothetical protein
VECGTRIGNRAGTASTLLAVSLLAIEEQLVEIETIAVLE